MSNLNKDISLLTTIPVSTLEKLGMIAESCICHDVSETLLDYDNVCKVDIGIGNLIIKVTDDNITYKFVPSRALEVKLINTVKYGEDALTVAIEDRLAEKIANVRKDLI